MLVLRRNKDSLMAVLEAFLYDPLLNWRLIEAKIRNNRSTNEVGSVSAGSAKEDSLGSLNINLSKKGLSSPDAGIAGSQPEAVNRQAVKTTSRVKDKLTGNDFPTEDGSSLTIPKQVDLLIQQATSNENLCQCYIGWCPFW